MAEQDQFQSSGREVYEGLRLKALTVPADQIGIDVDPDDPYLVVMDMGVRDAVVSVVGVLDGSASIYFSTGGGNIGGARHEPIRNAAKAFVEKSVEFLGEMEPTTEFPLPSEGRVSFYVVTPSTVYTAVDEEQALGLGQSALTPLFFAGQRVITEYRIVSQSTKKSRNDRERR